jgi:osmotically-inducible protein OsmY
MRRAATKKAEGTSEWSRRRLLGILAVAVAVAVLLIGGLAYAVYLAVAGIGDEASANTGVATGETERSTVARGAAHRDEIAAEPMLTVPESAAFPAETTSAKAPEIKIPTGTGVNGPAFVMTGFPQTPEGAIGQLAQIDLAVLQSMSLSTAEEVYNAWALPGGVRAEDWWITASVRAFLSSTGMGEVKDPSASVTLEPAAALVKGTDGPDWATVCVLMKVSATYKSEGQIAFAHCERMQWVGGRWMVAPGTPPAPAPATWPGTQLAHEAGWRTWSTDHTTEPAHPGDTEGEH